MTSWDCFYYTSICLIFNTLFIIYQMFLNTSNLLLFKNKINKALKSQMNFFGLLPVKKERQEKCAEKELESEAVDR